MKKLIAGAFILVALSGCQQLGKYDGQTAEEWFNKYDYADAEVENLRGRLSDVEAERDDWESQYYDMESEKDDWEEKYESLKQCVFMQDEDSSDCYYRY